MTTRKTVKGEGKAKKLKVKKETIRNLDASRKAKDVKGGMPGNYYGNATRIASCGWTFGLVCC